VRSRSTLVAVFSTLISVSPTPVALSKSPQATFALGPPGVALQPDNGLIVAANLSNTSDRNAFRVQIESMKLGSAALLPPTTFPILLGKMDAGQSATVQASFNGNQLTPGKQYLLVMNGSYRPVNKGVDKDEGHVFTVSTVMVFPPAAPGSSPARSVTVAAHQISGAPFPPQPPSFDDEVNPPIAPVPSAPFVRGLPTLTATDVIPAPFGDPPAIVFNANNSLGINDANDNPIGEPSGASAGSVVFVSANSYAAYSTDGGSHFTKLDPTTIFPNDIGFCCDQVVQYVPSSDRFIWLLQGSVTPGVLPAARLSAGFGQPSGHRQQRRHEVDLLDCHAEPLRLRRLRLPGHVGGIELPLHELGCRGRRMQRRAHGFTHVVGGAKGRRPDHRRIHRPDGWK
jgi:hypothetical protein